MAKKELSRKEKEQKEAERIEQIKENYSDYVKNIEARIATGETLEIVPYEKWVRKTIKDGVEIEVSGDSGETKNQRFKRLGKARMITALDSLDLLINLSAPQYEATPDEVAKMVTALRLKVLDIENSFKANAKAETKFDF